MYAQDNILCQFGLINLSSVQQLISQPILIHFWWELYQGGAIIPDYVTLWYLAGGSYMDIFYLISISQASFYCLLWKTIKAINNCPELWISWPYTKERQLDCATGFTSISTNHALWDCVAVLDGYHLQTITPSKKEEHNVQSYFSGHYQTYGVNIQAACDHNCHFLFIGIAGPGVMGD